MNFKIICLFFLLFTIVSSTTKEHRRSEVDKRFSTCDAQGFVKILSSIIEGTGALLTGVNFLKIGLSFINLSTSLITDGSSSSCTDEFKKFKDEVMRKLDKISNAINDVKSDVKCVQLKQNYRNDLKSKSGHLNGLLNQFLNGDKSQEIKEKIKSVCNSDSEGVNRLLASIHLYLEENEVSDYFENCCHYKKICVDDWHNKIKQFSYLFVYLVTSCEGVTGSTAKFNTNAFLEEIDKKVRTDTKEAEKRAKSDK